MVALKEVGDLAFAQFGVTELARGGRAAQHKLSALLRACLRALIRIDQLLDATGSEKLKALTLRQCQVLTSFKKYIIYINSIL